jgi:ankyrin repeat protein
MSLTPDDIPINEQNDLGYFPIQRAINYDDPEMLKLVIDGGADVNIDLGDGWTPLHEAFDYAIDGMIQNSRDIPYPENLEMIRILVSNGADLDRKNLKGKTPLDSINTYSATKEGFASLMNIFRPIIPFIDQKISYIDKRNP